MVSPSAVKWVFLKNVFLICALMIFVTGRRIYHKKENADAQSENDSELYFNGAETSKTDDPLSALTENDIPKSGELFEGDIIMDNNLRRAVLGIDDKRSAVYESEDGGSRHWAGGVVPYAIDESLPDVIREQIPHAVRTFALFTCIRFRPKTDADKDYVIFMDGEGCSSSVGRRGGSQKIHLAEGCHRFGTILHEMMHALGIIHEQSRPDRDTFITVLYINIKRKLLKNFQKYSFKKVDTLKLPYNYNSIMHYSNYAFTQNGKKTLVSKFDAKLHFGQRRMFSSLDIEEVNALYQCDAKITRKDLLYEDMTAKDILEKKRDEFKDEAMFREFLSRYL